MRLETYGRVKILRSSHAMDERMRRLARAHLISRFPPGEYNEPGTVNAIIQHQFQFFIAQLNEAIPYLANRESLETVLFQYDQSTEIIHGHGIERDDQLERWARLEGGFRRALKYLAELICLSAASPRPRQPAREQLAMDQALLAAEMVVDLAEGSNRTHSIFPDHAIARVYPPGGPIDWETTITGPHARYAEEMVDRLARDRQHRHRYVGEPQFDLDAGRHGPVLDEAFTDSNGCSYSNYLSALKNLIDNARPAPGLLPVLFLERRKITDAFISQGAPSAAIERMLTGFTIDPERMTKEGRVAWNPKQEHRALRRGFFLFPHELGPHLVFSRQMARESLIHLLNGVCYKRLPSDWRNPCVDAALERLSKQGSDWFEDTVRRNLTALGMTGGRIQHQIGVSAVCVPPDVGEIDYLGYHAKENLLVIAEAKMVLTGLEAKFWRDDLSAFVQGPQCYAAKFRRKIAWVSHHRSAIAEALGVPANAGVAPVMLTLYPGLARMFISDFPCVSLTELMLDFETAGRWPFPLVTPSA